MPLQGFVLSRQEVLSKLQSLLASLRIRGQGCDCIPQLRIEAFTLPLGEERLKGFPNELRTRLPCTGDFFHELPLELHGQSDAECNHDRQRAIGDVIHIVLPEAMQWQPRMPG